MEFFELLYLILHAASLAQQCKQLVLQLLIEFGLNVLNEIINFFAFIFFGFSDFLDGPLDIVHMLGKLLESLF